MDYKNDQQGGSAKMNKGREKNAEMTHLAHESVHDVSCEAQM